MSFCAFARVLRKSLSLVPAILLVASTSLFSAPTQAQDVSREKYAAIAVDAASGEILFARNIDDQRYPASVTKVMTLYILFEELAAGRMTLRSPIVMSRHAAAMQPSKLGLAPGKSITAEDAIRVVVTKSANDVAVAIAEAISGSESAFAARMTRTAKSLGMTRSVFVNASGLPNNKQVTTARDLATLGLRVQRDFPQYYKYFSLVSTEVAGKTFRSHNRILGKYRGADGIKTGYINASGFNLLASVRRDGKHVVGVVMGGKTANSRNQHMTKIFDETISKVPVRRNYKIAAAVGKPSFAAPDRFKGTPTPEPKTVLVATDARTTAGAAGKQQVDGRAMTALVERAVQQTDTSLATNDIPAGSELETGRSDLVQNDGSWKIQVGAFPTESGALQRINKVKASKIKPLVGKTGFTEAASGQKVFRARFSGFTQKSAQEACKALSQKSIDCLALSPQS